MSTSSPRIAQKTVNNAGAQRTVLAYPKGNTIKAARSASGARAITSMATIGNIRNNGIHKPNFVSLFRILIRMINGGLFILLTSLLPHRLLFLPFQAGIVLHPVLSGSHPSVCMRSSGQACVYRPDGLTGFSPSGNLSRTSLPYLLSSHD